jgi:integrase
MSVERVKRKGGDVWRVRWRDSSGRERSRTLGRKRDAEAFDAEIKRRKRIGELETVDAGKQTLAAFVEEWWRLYAEPNLARATLESYAIHWDAYALPYLGGLRLRELTPERIEDMRAKLVAAGVGPASIRKALVVLQSILQRAVEWRRVPHNPAKLVRKPPATRARAVRPLTPETIERMRAWLLERGQRRDAVLISVLAYAGLRPGEALALSWEQVRERTLLVERALSYGELKSTKTGQTRTVRLLVPLGADLREWRLASGRPEPEAFVFAARDGGPWSHDDAKNWRTRVFSPMLKALELPGTRPYDLRHSFCSLLIHEGATVVEVARQLGHSPTMSLDTYGHVFDELQGAERLSAEEQIQRARAKYVSVLCPFPAEEPTGGAENLEKSPQMQKARSRTRTDDPFLTMEVLYRTELSGHSALLCLTLAGSRSVGISRPAGAGIRPSHQ